VCGTIQLTQRRYDHIRQESNTLFYEGLPLLYKHTSFEDGARTRILANRAADMCTSVWWCGVLDVTLIVWPVAARIWLGVGTVHEEGDRDERTEKLQSLIHNKC
jgi:hypothetical protein